MHANYPQISSPLSCKIPDDNLRILASFIMHMMLLDSYSFRQQTQNRNILVDCLHFDRKLVFRGSAARPIWRSCSNGWGGGKCWNCSAPIVVLLKNFCTQPSLKILDLCRKRPTCKLHLQIACSLLWGRKRNSWKSCRRNKRGQWCRMHKLIYFQFGSLSVHFKEVSFFFYFGSNSKVCLMMLERIKTLILFPSRNSTTVLIFLVVVINLGVKVIDFSC